MAYHPPLAISEGGVPRAASRFCVALALASSLFGCEPVAREQEREREPVVVFEREPLVTPAQAQPSHLKVMAYNIKFGAGRVDFWFDFWGDRVELTRAEVTHNLDALCVLVRQYDPDILMTEEIEVNSRRSSYYDMVGGILQRTALNYGAYFQTWNSRYVPSEGLGRVDMGNAIFSKYPIRFAERIRHPDRTDLDPVKAGFYLHRALGRAEIAVSGQTVAAYVVHTEAYDQDGTKGRQLRQIHALVAEEPLPFALGGDFNELPPSALQLTGFADESPKALGTDFEQPPYTPQAMQPFFDDFTPAIPLERIGDTPASQKRYFSHSTLGPHQTNAQGETGFWNRTLDYLFLSKAQGWEPGTTDVLQTAGRMGITAEPLWLSDHAPIVGTWDLRP